MTQPKKYITRTISADLAEQWGLPFNLTDTADDREKYPELAFEVAREEGGHRRWYYVTELIFIAPDDQKFYHVIYYSGLTEMQEMDPWYDQKEITLTLVEPVEVTVVKYTRVRDNE